MNVRPESNLPPRAVGDHRAGWVVGAILAIALGIAYRDTFSAPLVLDDTQAITENFSIRQFATAWSPPPDTTVTGRPVVNLTLALNHALGGLEVRGYHVFNLAIHLLASLVLFGTVRRTLQNPRMPADVTRDSTLIAGGVALLWSLHPLQTEAVTYTIQRAESLVGLFYLLTLYAFARATRCHLLDDKRSGRDGRAWLAVSFFACLLGMATKEVMAGAPLLVLLYDRTFVAGSFRAAWQQRGKYYAALAATWLVLAALVFSSGSRNGTAGFGTAVSVTDYALTQCYAIPHYLWLALWPAALVFDYGRTVVTQPAALVVPALVLLALLGGTLAALRPRPFDAAHGRPIDAAPGNAAFGFLGAWFFAILTPSSSLVPIATQTMAEHRMYLPLAAVLTLVVVALHHWGGRRLTLSVSLAGAAALAAVTFQRNSLYCDSLALWSDTAAKAPDNLRATTNLGLALLQAGRGEETLRLYESAVARHPALADPRVNFANILSRAGRLDEAVAQYDAALQLEPENFEAHSNLGIALAQGGRPADALAHFEHVVRLKPAAIDAHRNLGLALAQLGRLDDALVQFAESIRLQPRDSSMHDTYGSALVRARRLPEAIREFEAATALDPKFAAVHNHLGHALTQAGRAADGLIELERAVQLAPGEATLRNDLGVALASGGRIDDARRQFEEAVRLHPDFAEAARNLARAREESSGR